MSDDDLDDDLSMDDSFDDFDKKGNTLGDLWRDNPLFKIGAIAVAAVLIFVVISSFSGGEDAAEPSVVGIAPDIKAVPGTEEASPAYVQAIEELNEADIERALNEGDSSLPVPIEPPVGIVSLPEETEQTEDPLQRWRRLQEERLEREIQQRETVVTADANSTDVARQEAIQALSDAFSQQMSSILETRNAGVPLSSVQLTDPNFLEALEAEEEAEALEALSAASVNEQVVGEVLLPAGQIAYAQLLTEANSDVPGPILAQIQSGPLKGSRILGTFERERELLTLNFDTIIVDDESLSIDAVAVDPGTTLPAMATDVDRRWFIRVVYPAAAAFIEGLADAVSESGLTTVTIEGDTVAEETEDADTEQEVAAGISEAGQEIGEILDDIADDTEILVRVESGTPLGILFLEPVVTNPEGQISSDLDAASVIDAAAP